MKAKIPIIHNRSGGDERILSKGGTFWVPPFLYGGGNGRDAYGLK